MKGSDIVKKLLIAGTVTGAGFYSYLQFIENRSLSSFLAEQIMNKSNIKNIFSERTEEDFKNFLEEQAVVQSKPVDNPQIYISSRVKNENKYKMQVFTWNDKRDPDQKVIYYFHGGAYVFQPTPFHFLTVDNIAKSLDAKVVFPIYPKVPLANYKDAYPRLLALYKEILATVNSPQQITVMGDSSGGGLTLGMGVFIKENEFPQPKDLILLSPWIDIFTQHPDMEAIYDYDPMLDPWLPARVGLLWADGAKDLNHPLVSPVFANVKGLAPMSIAIGTRDILYPSVNLFHEKLKDLGIPHTMKIAEKQAHVYQLLPTIEGHKARKQIKKIIKTEHKPQEQDLINFFINQELGIDNENDLY